MTLVLRTPSRRFWRNLALPQVLFSRALFSRHEERLYAWDPEIDIRDENGTLTFSVKVDGARPEDLGVTVDDGVVTIKGERQQERKVEREGYDWREISRSSFSRSLSLPKSAEWKETEASLEDGVLQVSIPIPTEEIPEAEKPASA